MPAPGDRRTASTTARITHRRSAVDCAGASTIGPPLRARRDTESITFGASRRGDGARCRDEPILGRSAGSGTLRRRTSISTKTNHPLRLWSRLYRRLGHHVGGSIGRVQKGENPRAGSSAQGLEPPDPRPPDRVTIVGGAVSELDWTIDPDGDATDPKRNARPSKTRGRLFRVKRIPDRRRSGRWVVVAVQVASGLGQDPGP
jgi:hypothetical protein